MVSGWFLARGHWKDEQISSRTHVCDQLVEMNSDTSDEAAHLLCVCLPSSPHLHGVFFPLAAGARSGEPGLVFLCFTLPSTPPSQQLVGNVFSTRIASCAAWAHCVSPMPMNLRPDGSGTAVKSAFQCCLLRWFWSITAPEMYRHTGEH